MRVDYHERTMITQPAVVVAKKLKSKSNEKNKKKQKISTFDDLPNTISKHLI